MAYSPRKAAEVIAYFLIKNNKRPLGIVKVMNLVYLADRLSISRFAHPILDECRVSMPHGPVNSLTYSYVNGEIPPNYDNGWSSILNDRCDNKVGLAKDHISEEGLLELSDAELNVLGETWEQFGLMETWEIVDWIHNPQNVPEWENPNGSFKEISVKVIMEAVGVSNAELAAAEYNDKLAVDGFLKSYINKE